MSTALLVIDSSEIRQIRRKKIGSLSDFDKIAARLYRAAEAVKQGWADIPLEDRELLRELAYRLIEPSKGFSRLWEKIRGRFYMVFITATNQTEAFNSCVEALNLLVENILDAVEREEASYQTALSDTLEQMYLEKEKVRVLEANETRGWLRNLSNQALEEI